MTRTCQATQQLFEQLGSLTAAGRIAEGLAQGAVEMSGVVQRRQLPRHQIERVVLATADTVPCDVIPIFATGQLVIDATALIEDMPEPPEPPCARLDERVPPQRYQIEIWAEKTTMNDILDPLAERYSATLVTGVGELSATACRLCVERAELDGRPVRILYISDFDPAGQSMPVAVARKIEFLLQETGLDLDIQVRPVVLTAQQCEDYALPRTPIKETELRAGAFEQRHGEGATELDSLEALHPGVLAEILDQEIGRYYDATLAQRTAQTAEQVRATLDDFNAEIHERFAADIVQVQTEYQAIMAAYQRWRERTETRWQAITNTLDVEAPDLSESSLSRPRSSAQAKIGP